MHESKQETRKVIAVVNSDENVLSVLKGSIYVKNRYLYPRKV